MKPLSLSKATIVVLSLIASQASADTIGLCICQVVCTPVLLAGCVAAGSIWGNASGVAVAHAAFGGAVVGPDMIALCSNPFGTCQAVCMRIF